MKNKNITRTDLLFLALWPVAITILSWFTSYGFAVNSVLLFGGISFYLSLKNRHAVNRALIFSIIFALAGSFVIDYFGHLDGSWYISTIFPFRIFGVATLEGYIWAFCLTYCIIMLYEHLFDHSRHKLVARRMAYFIPVAISILFVFILSMFFTDRSVNVSYLYLRWMLFMLFTTALFLIAFPRYLKRLAIISSYFFAVGMLQEVIALSKGYWSFPGQNFIGWISIGQFRFPYEELFFWMFIFSTGVIAYFEFFDDNRLNFKPRKSLKAK